MASTESNIPRECFQCGYAIVELNYDAEAQRSGWFVCDNCGERIMSVADAVTHAKAHQEQAVRDKLGVDEFLSGRRSKG